MKLIDYTELAENGVSLETIHMIHKQKELEYLKSDGKSEEAVITCSLCEEVG